MSVDPPATTPVRRTLRWLSPGGGVLGARRVPVIELEAERAEQGITPRDFTDEEIVRRYMAAMVNEAAKVVGEGIARRPLDVDVTLLYGYGFPRYWGGPLKWADIVGLDGLLADIKSWAAEDDYFWQPAPLLEKLVAEGKTFEDLNKEAAG